MNIPICGLAGTYNVSVSVLLPVSLPPRLRLSSGRRQSASILIHGCVGSQCSGPVRSVALVGVDISTPRHVHVVVVEGRVEVRALAGASLHVLIDTGVAR